MTTPNEVNLKKRDERVFESLKANSPLDMEKIRGHLRQLWVLDENARPVYFTSNVLINGAHIYINRHAFFKKDGVTSVRVAIRLRPDDSLILGNVTYQFCEVLIGTGKLESADLLRFARSNMKAAFATPKAISVMCPTVHLGVSLFYLGPEDTLCSSTGLVTDVDTKKKDFGFSGTTDETFCGGVYVNHLTGSFVGTHYLGLKPTSMPNRGLMLPLN
jgi:hypothetical protein